MRRTKLHSVRMALAVGVVLALGAATGPATQAEESKTGFSFKGPSIITVGEEADLTVTYTSLRLANEGGRRPVISMENTGSVAMNRDRGTVGFLNGIDVDTSYEGGKKIGDDTIKETVRIRGLGVGTVKVRFYVEALNAETTRTIEVVPNLSDYEVEMHGTLAMKVGETVDFWALSTPWRAGSYSTRGTFSWSAYHPYFDRPRNQTDERNQSSVSVRALLPGTGTLSAFFQPIHYEMAGGVEVERRIKIVLPLDIAGPSKAAAGTTVKLQANLDTSGLAVDGGFAWLVENVSGTAQFISSTNRQRGMHTNSVADIALKSPGRIKITSRFFPAAKAADKSPVTDVWYLDIVAPEKASTSARLTDGSTVLPAPRNQPNPKALEDARTQHQKTFVPGVIPGAGQTPLGPNGLPVPNDSQEPNPGGTILPQPDGKEQSFRPGPYVPPPQFGSEVLPGPAPMQDGIVVPASDTESFGYRSAPDPVFDRREKCDCAEDDERHFKD